VIPNAGCTGNVCEIVNKNLMNGIDILKSEKLSFCVGCIEGKIHSNPFTPVAKICSAEKLLLIHSDADGPMSTETTQLKLFSRWLCSFPY